MTKQEKDIYLRLLSISFVIHSYQIGDKQYFYTLFPSVDQDILEKIWLTETKKSPIVSFYEQISDSEELLIKNKLNRLGHNEVKLFDYLSKPLDKNLDIKTESALRKLMASRYIEIAVFSINNLLGIPEKFLSKVFKEKRNLRRRRIFIGFTVIIAIAFSLPRVIEGLTPVESLARRYHEESRYTYSGSLCWDGWESHSRGRGTCSHHGGVKSYFEKGDYSLTFQQCLEKAKQKSWIE